MTYDFNALYSGDDEMKINIGMCEYSCPNSRKCRRHADSGTVPEYHQKYMIVHGGAEFCTHYYPLPIESCKTGWNKPSHEAMP